MLSLLVSVLFAQTADDLVGRLEAKAVAARGIVIRTHFEVDSVGGDERYERGCGGARTEVSTKGTLWNEAWTLWIGPERRSVTTSSIRSLASREEFVQLMRELGGFDPKMEDKRLSVTPSGGVWKTHPGLDPWLARGNGTIGDGVNPLLLYALMPELLRTEAELKIAGSDDPVWILECRRKGAWGPITKKLTIGKAELDLQRVEIVEGRGTWEYKYEFEAVGAASVRGLKLPLEVRARRHSFSSLYRWKHRVDDRAGEPRLRSRQDFAENNLPTPGLLDMKETELRRLLHPEDPQPLVDLAWGRFPWKRWWHYRHSQERENNRWMLKALRELNPASSAAREEWLYRTWRPGDPDEERMIEGAPAPLFNHAGKLLAAGMREEAEAIARKGLSTADSPGDRINWTCLLAAILSRQGKNADAAKLWLDLTGTLEDGESSTQVFLAEAAIGRGLAVGFDPVTLTQANGLAPALLLLGRVEGEDFARVVRIAASAVAARPLLSEIVVQRKIGNAGLAKELAATADVDLLLAAAALRNAAGESADELGKAAVDLWEKEAYCRLWTWDVWGRTTLRMLKHLRALGQDGLALRLASSFVEKCAAGKVSMWLGIYRWGDLVGKCLLPLRSQGQEARYVELLTLSPDLASRVEFDRREESDLPVKGIQDRLRKTRSREEAIGWIRAAASGDMKPEALRPLAELAREIAPDDLDVENAWAKVAGENLSLDQHVDLFRRSIAATKAGTYSDRTGGNYGMMYERLAQLQLEGGKPDEAAATTREMLREAPDMDSQLVINLGTAMGGKGRMDLQKELYLLAARHNAHLRPFSARNVIERLEPFGEHADIYALCVRTLRTWKDGGAHDQNERTHLEAIRKAFERVAPKVAWADVFKPWLDQAHPEVPKERAELAAKALADLNADQAEKRNRAERILDLMGRSAVPLLRMSALGERGAEVRGRARAIVERIYVESWGQN